MLLPLQYWCWIGAGYLQWRIWGEYIWFWITLVVSFVLYLPLYLWSRGNIKIDDEIWWKFHFQRADPLADPALKGGRYRALVMLASVPLLTPLTRCSQTCHRRYPLVYCISILPLSVVRWITFVHPNSVSGTATFAVVAIYGLSGACNAVLLLTTRPESELFSKPTLYAAGRAPSPLGGYSMQNDFDQSGSTDAEVELGRLPSRS